MPQFSFYQLLTFHLSFAPINFPSPVSQRISSKKPVILESENFKMWKLKRKFYFSRCLKIDTTCSLFSKCKQISEFSFGGIDSFCFIYSINNFLKFVEMENKSRIRPENGLLIEKNGKTMYLVKAIELYDESYSRLMKKKVNFSLVSGR